MGTLFKFIAKQTMAVQAGGCREASVRVGGITESGLNPPVCGGKPVSVATQAEVLYLSRRLWRG